MIENDFKLSRLRPALLAVILALAMLVGLKGSHLDGTSPDVAHAAPAVDAGLVDLSKTDVDNPAISVDPQQAHAGSVVLPPARPPADGSGNVDSVTGAVCMQDVYDGFGQGGSLNCTANDVSLATATNITILDDGCAFPGDTVDFTADFEVVVTAGSRHDVGINSRLTEIPMATGPSPEPVRSAPRLMAHPPPGATSTQQTMTPQTRMTSVIVRSMAAPL